MRKLKVRYRPNAHDNIHVGDSAVLYSGTVDHPRLNNLGGTVWTSEVVRITKRGFHTLNTIYIRLGQ